MAIAPDIIHGYGVPPAMAEPARSGGGLPFGEVTIPLFNYKIPTVALIGIALFVLFLLHLAGWRFVGVVGASAGVG